MNCFPTGSFKWKRSSSTAWTAAEGAFSLENGPPGIAFMAKNVMAEMINTVSSASSTRLQTYLPVLLEKYSAPAISTSTTPRRIFSVRIGRKSHPAAKMASETTV